MIILVSNPLKDPTSLVYPCFSYSFERRNTKASIICCVGTLTITGSLHHIDMVFLGWWSCEKLLVCEHDQSCVQKYVG
ncbi:hypothetical protein MKW98_016946 [Papaver atlanticum]|uniref:Uncharacterized protein n=1 Tax=Papaver atlanticum TaxID=357466 RepID=A0AAD4TK06_9MAGN|nr:hypothetical protein MKW98_016946 [Papaver atlanticum]